MSGVLVGTMGIGCILLAASFFFRDDTFKKCLALWGIVIIVAGLLAGVFLVRCGSCGKITYRFVDKCSWCGEELEDIESVGEILDRSRG